MITGSCSLVISNYIIIIDTYLPVNMYCESQEKAQSQTHLSALLFRVFRRLKSAVDQILQVPSADVVANKLIILK